jgi:hypothetical protein
MIEFVLKSLDDPGFYLGIAVVLVPLFVTFLILRRKKLLFEVVCEAKLLGSEGSNLQYATEISNESEPMLFVIDLHNAVGSLVRVGNIDIAPAQYQSEIAFRFGENAHLLEAGVLETPSDIEAKAHISSYGRDKVSLEAVPLNRGDLIRLKAVVKNPKAEPEPQWVGGGIRYTLRVEGQIRGIRKIQRKWDSQKLLVYAFLVGLLSVVLDYSVVEWARGLLTGDRTWLVGPPVLLLGVQVAFVGLSAILLIIALLKDKKSREIAKQLGASYPIAERKPRMGWS